MIKRTEVAEFLYDLIPIADKWGITDDSERAIKIKDATDKELLELTNIQDDKIEGLSDWLCSDSAMIEPITESYVIFSCFLMAYDHARVILKNKTLI